MRDGKEAGVAYLIAGVLLLLFGIRALFRPQALPYDLPRYPFVHQYGGALTSTLVGLVLLVAGVLAFLHVTPAQPGLVLLDRYEPATGLGALLGVPLVLILSLVPLSLPSFLNSRELPMGQLVATMVFTAIMLFGIWVALHYRRDSVADPQARAVEVRYGKPWIFWRRTLRFADFQWVDIETVERSPGLRRFHVYRVVAGGPTRKPKMIGFWYSRGEAEVTVRDVVRVTGWEDRTRQQ